MKTSRWRILCGSSLDTSRPRRRGPSGGSKTSRRAVVCRAFDKADYTAGDTLHITGGPR